MRPPQPFTIGRSSRSTSEWYWARPPLTWWARMSPNCGYGRSSWPRAMVGWSAKAPKAGLPKNGFGTWSSRAEPRDWYFGSSWLMLTVVVVVAAQAEPPRGGADVADARHQSRPGSSRWKSTEYWWT